MINPQEVLEGYSLYKILDKYARVWEIDGKIIEKRNKAYFTGTCEHTEDGEHIEGTDQMLLHFLFESEKEGFYLDVDTGEYKVLHGLIVKHNYLINPSTPLEEQILEKYEDFFNQVMDSHFLNHK